jgi:hypothetical protein
MRISRGRPSLPVLCCAAVAATCWMGAAAAQAATTVYPAGGSTFTGGAQGWETTGATCNVGLLCTASGAYNGSVGNPPGALAANTNATVNLLTVFKSTISFQSPNFKVDGAGAAAMHLDREFAPGGLGPLAPETTYTAKLIDRTASQESTPIAETVKAASTWSGVDAASSVTAGHTYAIAITAVTTSTLPAVSLISGETSVRFDNVSLSVQASGGEKGGGPANGQQLAGLLRNSLIGPARLKGGRLSVRAKCPSAVGVACRTSVQGLLGKHRVATAVRTSKVGKGKVKRFVLKVKPKARGRLATKKRLLFKETVKAGSAKATVYKQLKLVHSH